MARIETVELYFLLPWGTKSLHPSWRLNPSPVTLLPVATASLSQDGLAHGVGPQRETQAWFAIPGSGQASWGVGGGAHPDPDSLWSPADPGEPHELL